MLVEGVQRGMAAGGVEHGFLMGHSEQLIGHFQSLTRSALLEAPAAKPPSPGG
jgi:hypothetical protein